MTNPQQPTLVEALKACVETGLDYMTDYQDAQPNDMTRGDIERSRAALSLAETTDGEPTGRVGGDETGWLIERDGKWYAAGPHTKWTVNQAIDPGLWRENWTTDANKALRFVRKVDADALIKFEGWQTAAATEHKWLSIPKPIGHLYREFDTHKFRRPIEPLTQPPQDVNPGQPHHPTPSVEAVARIIDEHIEIERADIVHEGRLVEVNIIKGAPEAATAILALTAQQHPALGSGGPTALFVRASELATEKVEALYDEIDASTHEAFSIAIYEGVEEAWREAYGDNRPAQPPPPRSQERAGGET